MVDNPDLNVTKRTFGGIFTKAYYRTCNAEVITASFKATGIWPVNFNEIDPIIFRPALNFVEKESESNEIEENEIESENEIAN